MFTNYGSGLSSFQSNLVHYHPIWSILVQFGPLWSTLVHFNQIQSILMFSLKNEKRQFWVKNTINYSNSIPYVICCSVVFISHTLLHTKYSQPRFCTKLVTLKLRFHVCVYFMCNSVYGLIYYYPMLYLCHCVFLFFWMNGVEKITVFPMLFMIFLMYVLTSITRKKIIPS